MYNKEKVEYYAHKYNLSPIVIELIFARGIDENDIDKYLSPSLANLHDPYLLNDMKEFVSRVEKAIASKEKVLIFGDYDVDGVSASAILIKYFSSRNFYVDYYLPNRYIDGYGLTNEVIDKIKLQYNPSLIITVDCGISCHEEVEYAKKVGIEIIISDHHDIPEIVPKTLVINPKLPNQKYPFSQLCGTGVAFKIVQALGGLDEAKKFLGICAIATIADIVPLIDENRIIVSCGLRVLDRTLPTGIKALMRENKLALEQVTASDIAYKLSPKINAAGRMGDASVALKLYLEENKQIIADTIQNLNDMNIARQALCNKIYDEAKDRLSKINISNYFSLVLSSKDWDAGVLGIVAAKIAGEFNRPTVLFSQVGDELKGSARSVNDINIFDTITSIKEVVEAFGGHKMAAGLTIKAKNYKNFINSLNAALKAKYTMFDLVPRDDYDYEINPDQITNKLVNDLNLLEPYGVGNEKPTFAISTNKVYAASMNNYINHLNITADNFNIVAFNSFKYLHMLKNTESQQILFELQKNEYKGKSYTKGIAKKIKTGIIIKPKEDLLYGQYLKQLSYTNADCLIKEYAANELDKLVDTAIQMPFGNLFIANNYQTYMDFVKRANTKNLKLVNDLLFVSQNNGLNTILLGPIGNKDFSSFNKIVFLDAILDKSYLGRISKDTKAKIFIPKDKKFPRELFDNLVDDRQVFGEYFKGFSTLASKRLSYLDEFDIYKQYKIHFPDKKVNYKQFVYCLYTFIELGIFDLIEDNDYLIIKENEKVFAPLNNSTFYNRVSFLLKAAGK